MAPTWKALSNGMKIAVLGALGMHPWGRSFKVYAIVCKPDFPPLWHYEHWCRIAPQLQSTIDLLADLPVVESWQGREGQPNWIRAQARPWSDATDRKWTHYAPNDSTRPKRVEDREFSHMQAWSPSRIFCGNTDNVPKFFLSLDCWFQSAVDGPTSQLCQMIVVAVPSNSSGEILRATSEGVSRLAESVEAVLAVTSTRSWHMKIQETSLSHHLPYTQHLIAKGVRIGEAPLTPMSLIGEWESLPFPASPP